MSSLNTLFSALLPKTCISCKKEGAHLCEDCLATVSINTEVFPHESPSLKKLLCATSLSEPVIQKALRYYKNPPFLRDLSSQFAFLIISHVINSHNEEILNNSLLLPIPISGKEERQRGFNHIAKITKELSSALNIPITSLDAVTDKRILLIDDVYETGERMEDMASELTKNGINEIWGIVVAR